MSRLYKVFAFVLVAAVLLLPTAAGAEDSGLSYTYLPIALGGGQSSGPDLVQFRSCGGYDGIPLQFKQVPVGPLTALSEECTGGEAYPAPIANENEGVVLVGYFWSETNWSLSVHLTKWLGMDQQFQVNMGTRGSPPPYLSVNALDGELKVFRGSETFTETTVIDGWTFTPHLDAVRPYVEFKRDQTTIWIAIDETGSLWVEVQTPEVELTAQDQEPHWGAWYYTLCNGHLPSLEELETEYIIARYPFS